MNQGIAVNPTPGEEHSFWAEQYGSRVTPAQVIFDLVGGVLLPMVCLWFDPIVFRSGAIGEPMLGSIKAAAYSFVAIEIVTLLVWLSIGQHLTRLVGLQTGILFAGALGATAVGIVLLPISLIGLFAIIGVLGFSPFIVAWIFLRNGLRAARIANRSSRVSGIAQCWIGGLLVAIGAIFVQTECVRQTSKLLDAAIDGDKTASKAALERVTRWRWGISQIADLDRLVMAFANETDQTRRDRIADVYEKIAGENIELRLAVMND